jgi:TolB protein
VIGSTAVLEIYAYEVKEGKLVLGRKYEGPTDGIRRLGHTFANDFYTAITNKPGFFLSQIVVASDTGPQTHKEIYIMDWDGENSKPITSHKTISFSPDWSRDGSLISYTSFIKRTVDGQKNTRNSDLFIYEVKTGRRWLVSYRKGINSGSHFLPDAKSLLLTLSKGPRTDLFRMSIDGKTIVPLTTGTRSEINVEPSVSKDGSKIAFASDRHGKPMVYMMNADGSNVQRMTFAGHFNSNPSFSPDGKWIAFAGYPDGQDNFEIYMISTDKASLVRLTRARNKYGGWSNNEEPVFSPDGRQLLFVSDRTGKRQLYMINTDGTNERPITNDDRNYFRPKWGPPGGVTRN